MSVPIDYYAEIITQVLADEKALTKFIASRSEVSPKFLTSYFIFNINFSFWIHHVFLLFFVLGRN
jgi:hypothetical protein